MTYFPERIGTASISITRSIAVVAALSLSIVRPTIAATEHIAPGGVADTFPGTYDPQYRATVPPIALSITPTSGPITGGTSFTLTGRFFSSGATVTFDGILATQLVIGESTITGHTPAHATGAVDVTVTNLDGRISTLVGVFTYALEVGSPTTIGQGLQTLPSPTSEPAPAPGAPPASVPSPAPGAPPASAPSPAPRMSNPSSMSAIARVSVFQHADNGSTAIRIDLDGKEAAKAAMRELPSIIKRYGVDR
jgi:hypothetical protein